MDKCRLIRIRDEILSNLNYLSVSDGSLSPLGRRFIGMAWDQEEGSGVHSGKG